MKLGIDTCVKIESITIGAITEALMGECDAFVDDVDSLLDLKQAIRDAHHTCFPNSPSYAAPQQAPAEPDTPFDYPKALR